MMFDSIETYEKYKNDKKILKEIQKSKEKLEKRKEFHEREKKNFLEKQQSLIEAKTARRMQRDRSKINLSFEKKVRKIQGKKPLKSHAKDPIPGLKKKCYQAAQLLARLSDCDMHGYGNCISCGKRIHRTEGDGGHYISRAHMATAFDLRNIHLQCKNCNGNLRGNTIAYRENLVKKYGEETVLELERLKNETKNWTKEELESLLGNFNFLIELQKKKLI